MSNYACVDCCKPESECRCNVVTIKKLQSQLQAKEQELEMYKVNYECVDQVLAKEIIKTEQQAERIKVLEEALEKREWKDLPKLDDYIDIEALEDK